MPQARSTCSALLRSPCKLAEGSKSERRFQTPKDGEKRTGQMASATTNEKLRMSKTEAIIARFEERGT